MPINVSILRVKSIYKKSIEYDIPQSYFSWFLKYLKKRKARFPDS